MAKAFVKDLGAYIRAGYPIVTIVSSEENRALELIDELLHQKEMWKQSRYALLPARAAQPRTFYLVCSFSAPCLGITESPEIRDQNNRSHLTMPEYISAPSMS